MMRWRDDFQCQVAGHESAKSLPKQKEANQQQTKQEILRNPLSMPGPSFRGTTRVFRCLGYKMLQVQEGSTVMIFLLSRFANTSKLTQDHYRIIGGKGMIRKSTMVQRTSKNPYAAYFVHLVHSGPTLIQLWLSIWQGRVELNVSPTCAIQDTQLFCLFIVHCCALFSLYWSKIGQRAERKCWSYHQSHGPSHINYLEYLLDDVISSL